MVRFSKVRALTMGALAIAALVASGVTQASAISGTATVTSLNPDRDFFPGQVLQVGGSGCITPNGLPNSAQVILRGPGGSTAVVSVSEFPTPALVAPNGTFSGIVTIPFIAAVGSTYKVSAQCTEQGQPPGPESAGLVLTVTRGRPAPTPVPPGTEFGTFDQSRPGTAGPATRGNGRAATTGRASPISAQPRFTG